jgi:hypothetical protein
MGTTASKLPKIAAICDRNRWAASSTKPCTPASSSMCLSLAAMAGAVTAGCLVATAQCSNMTRTNDKA